MANTGKLEISIDNGESWTQVAPSKANVDFEQAFTEHAVTIEVQLDDYRQFWKALKWALYWRDRLN